MVTPNERSELVEATAWRRVRVHAAGATARGVPIAPAIYDAWIARFLAVLTEYSGGGATIYPPAMGVWRGSREPVRVIEVVMPNAAWHRARPAIDAVAQRFLAATCQETVLVTAEHLAPDEVWFLTAHDGGGVVAGGAP